MFRQEIYWKDKRAFFVWEGSPEHIAIQKAQDRKIIEDEAKPRL